MYIDTWDGVIEWAQNTWINERMAQEEQGKRGEQMISTRAKNKTWNERSLWDRNVIWCQLRIRECFYFKSTDSLTISKLCVRGVWEEGGDGSSSAIAGDVTKPLALVALDGVTTTAAASTPGFLAVAGEMTWLAAIVAVSATASTTTPARALARDVALLVAIVASHGAAASVSASTTALTRLGTFARDVASLAAVVARTVAHLEIVQKLS